MTPVFTISDALHVGWKRLTNNFWFLVLLTLVFLGVSVILDQTKDSMIAVDVLSRVVDMFVSFFGMFTMIRFSLMIAKDQHPRWKDIIDFDSRLLGMYILASLMFTIAQVVGFTLLIIPGIYILVRLGFFGFILVDQNVDSMPALKKSWEMTKGRFWPIFWAFVVVGLINILGAITIGIGLLITIPLSVLYVGYVYEKLKHAPPVPVSVPAPVPAQADSVPKAN